MKNYALATAVLATVSLSACDNDDDQAPVNEGQATIEMTDAPIDNAEVKGVFVTVTQIKVDGQPFEGFQGPQTINLLALQNGKTEVLGSGALAARSYNSLSLTLNTETDEDGNTPGSYVMLANGTKDKLEAEAGNTLEIVVSDAYAVKEEGESNLVVDFDLRKAVEASASDYSFVAASELGKSLRVVRKDRTGTIKGNYDEGNEQSGLDDKVVVYAYEKGTFNAATETSGEQKFKGAVTSALVNKGSLNSNFTLAFLEEGTYELVFARYSDDDKDGKLTFESMLDVAASGNTSLNNIQVDAGASLTLNLLVSGIL